MALYHRERPEHLRAALESLVAQTLPATEIVVVKDANLPDELENVLESYDPHLRIKAIQQDRRTDLGTALQAGILECSCEIVARVDTDDISQRDRFRKQVEFLKENREVDVVGSWISEFDRNPDNIYAYKKFPVHHRDIYEFAKSRCPVGHMSAMYKRSAVIEAGNYQTFHGIGMEDYDLWVRMLMKGCRFATIPEVLVNVSAGEVMAKRRGGLRHAYNEVMLQRRFLESGFLTPWEALWNLITRVPFVLIPSGARFLIQRTLFRRNSL